MNRAPETYDVEPPDYATALRIGLGRALEQDRQRVLQTLRSQASASGDAFTVQLVDISPETFAPMKDLPL